MALKRDVVVQNAEKLVAKGKIEAAIKEYLRLIEENANDTNILNRVGDLYVRINRIKEATKYFYDIAKFWAEDGFYLKSIAILKKINKLDPSILEVYDKLGELYAKQGMNTEAASHYQYLADYLGRQGKSAEALGIYKKITAMDPDNIAMRGKLAELFNAAGDTKEAVAEYQTIGKMLITKGHIQEAIQVYNRALKLDPKNILMIKDLAASLLAEGRNADVAKVLESTAALQQNDPQVFQILAQAYLGTGQVANAMDAVTMGLRKAPNHDPLQELKGDILAAMGRQEDAIVAYHQAVDLALNVRDHSRALALCQKVLHKNPVHIATLQKTVEIHTRLKQETHVLQSLSQLAEAYVHFKMYGDASETLERLIQMEPDNAQHREKLAFIRQRMGKRVTLQEMVQPEVAVEEVAELPEIEIPLPETARPAAVEAQGEGVLLEEELPADLKDYVSEHMVEIDVFTKYNLTEKAVQGLQTILERIPNYIPSLEKLLQIFLEENRVEETQKVGKRLVELYARRNLGDREENLREQLLMQGISLEEREGAQGARPPVPSDTLVSVPEEEVPAGQADETAEFDRGAVVAAKPSLDLELDMDSDESVLLEPVKGFELPEETETRPETASGSAGDISLEFEEPTLELEAEPVPELNAESSVEMEAEPVLELDTAPALELEAGQEMELEGAAELEAIPEPEPMPELLTAPELPHPPSPPAKATPPSPKATAPPTPAKPPSKPAPDLSLDKLFKAEKPPIKPKPAIAPGLDLLQPGKGTKKEVPAPKGGSDLSPLGPTLRKPIPGPKIRVEAPVAKGLEDLNIFAGSLKEKPKKRPAAPAPSPPAPPAHPPQPETAASGLSDILNMQEEIGSLLQESIPVETEPPVEVLGELDFYMEQEIVDEAEKLLAELKNRFPDHPEVRTRAKKFDALMKKAGPLAAALPPEIKDGESLFSEEEEFFDLASELEEDLSEEKKEMALPPQVEPTLEEVFQQFKQGVQQTLSPEDYDTHYNLGIAYKEMGLVDEAISEFQIACKDPTRLIDCCSMLGMCFMEKGMPQLAEKWYRKAMESPDISEDEQLGLLYDLGSLYMQSGDIENAYKSFIEIYSTRNSYRDVEDRVKELEQARKAAN
jgi:tetratricopeptide (TPR) repeat protein